MPLILWTHKGQTEPRALHSDAILACQRGQAFSIVAATGNLSIPFLGRKVVIACRPARVPVQVHPIEHLTLHLSHIKGVYCFVLEPPGLKSTKGGFQLFLHALE